MLEGTNEKLAAQYAELLAGEAAIEAVSAMADAPATIVDAMRSTLAATFESMAITLQGYSGAFESVSKASESARKAAPNANGERNADTFRIVPTVKTETLSAILDRGARPHGCEYCQHDPVGGINVDLDRSAAATKAAKTELGALPIGCSVLVTPNLQPESRLTGGAKTRKASGSPRSGEAAHSGPKGENALIELGNIDLPAANYRNAEYKARIIDGPTGKVVEITEAGEVGQLKGETFGSLSASANAVVEAVYAKRGWTYDDKTNRVDGKKFWSVKTVNNSN